jgi:hypothetical protein
VVDAYLGMVDLQEKSIEKPVKRRGIFMRFMIGRRIH